MNQDELYDVYEGISEEITDLVMLRLAERNASEEEQLWVKELLDEQFRFYRI